MFACVKLYVAHSYLKNSIWIFCIALSIRAIYFYFFVEPSYLFSEDQALYIHLAQEFPTSGFFGVMPQRVPGYPLFLSTIFTIFGENILNVVLVQILLDSISCVVIALMARLLFRKGFWIAGVLSSANLSMIILSATLLTDTLFLFFFVLFLFSLLKYLQTKSVRWFFLLALFISLATLVRAASYYILPILLVGLLIWRLWQKDNSLKIIQLTVLYLFVVGTLLGGIHHRNYQQYGSTEFVTQTGGAILGWIIPAIYQYSGQGSYQEGQKLAREKLDLALQNDNLEKLSSNPFLSSAYQTRVGKDIMLEFGFINVIQAWVVGSAINLLSPSIAYAPSLRSIKHPSFYKTRGNGIFYKLSNYIKNSSEPYYLLALAAGMATSIIFTVLALVGMFKMILEFPSVTVTILILLVIYFFAITGPIIGIKYRLPVEPILTLFITYFLNQANIKFR
jgi:4-amino-4-deoxy-L-arabinose transferase-like glycosyltransferase